MPEPPPRSPHDARGLTPPGGTAARVLLLSCCAPCSGDIMATMSAAGIAYTVFFYNPNIHPASEYRRRKDENKRYAERLGVPFVDADYDTDAWFARTKGLEDEPERGRRCTVCFDMRLGRAARHAHDHGFPVLTSSLALSRWKNRTQVNACAHRAVAPYDGLVYWDHDWRKGGGVDRALDIARREEFYRQDYCGCLYSLSSASRRRRA
ncbi:epoxyqueuosine reductase QueH [Rhodospira trueperi]|uniref:Epoxyqueuosine reductase QueH n=1 Tax=Rhodospira trueperi TaxID=69960 RepID=A0A1G7D7M4_9PROT|nr:epoxyqueuosine reductase QueH [Rhodospira trueperi]SDE47638.1 hypothetical protein SAMN05421720_10771 [Rhodospira trueperi]